MFELRIDVPEAYPMVPPRISFVTPVFHPNVLWRTGEICLDILKSNWTPTWDLQGACRAIQALLADPAADSPLNCDAGASSGGAGAGWFAAHGGATVVACLRPPTNR